MDFSIFSIWTSPLSLVGGSGVIVFNFTSFFDYILLSKQNIHKANCTHLGPCCLNVSHIKIDRLICIININIYFARKASVFECTGVKKIKSTNII